ncbi:acetyl-CoA synthetase-like protein [Setomelanomma holmii]|uniref:Acetyl-CoA synthetase-like protein n=1 Tax=Setomelanomma holmii TaxID=210430 RepID=A0A9P4HKC0_9PLEO|nr:acetyl-CoA synthetase-like protein [Setomelanomma holmii]
MKSSGTAPYGQRLLPVTIDEIAKNDPNRIAFSFPRSSELSAGFRDVSFRTFANAIDKTARFIQKEIGRNSTFETVLYMGYPDIRHFIILVALIKTGHKVLFSSHRNSIAGHANLIQKTRCATLIHSDGFPVAEILATCQIKTACMPDLDILLADTPSDHYPYSKTFDEAKDDEVLVLHTSGTTGLPKPVVWSNATTVTTDAHQLLPPLDNRPCLWGSWFRANGRSFSALPVFHGAGIASGILRSVFLDTVIVIGPPGLTTADTFDQVLEYGNIDTAGCLPITLDEVAKRPDILAKLHKLKSITFVGAGLLSQETGDIIARHCHLVNIIASTETSTLIQYITDPEDWQYLCIDSRHNGIEWRPVGGDTDLYEPIFVRDPKQELFQGIFKNFPSLKEYSMSDLYTKHPTKTHHWKHEGRKDDLIVFQSGWNFNPIIHEDHIRSHPSVQNCILVGTGRHKAAAIVELGPNAYTEEVEGQKRLLEGIWPKIEEANRFADTTGQLEKDLILFAKKERPFAMTGKGSIQRKATEKLYEPEINELFASIKDQYGREPAI